MAVFTDTFDRADSTNLGADWTELVGDVRIFSNWCENVTLGSEVVAHWTADAGSADIYASGHIFHQGLVVDSTTGMGFILRKDGSATQTYYYFELLFFVAGVAVNSINLYKCIAGVYGSPVAAETVTLVHNTSYLVRVEATTSNLSFIINGVTELTYTDPSGVLTGQRAGIRAFANHAEAATWLDFEWGDLAMDPSSEGDAGYKPTYKPRRGR